MKSTGIVRKVDELGRIVLPMELRRTLGIGQRDPIEIFVEQENVILRKYSPDKTCMITGEYSEETISLCEGKINLSPEGVDNLLKELESKMLA
jgi:transcriptional pleiotropic regulator of transition state genes